MKKEELNFDEGKNELNRLSNLDTRKVTAATHNFKQKFNKLTDNQKSKFAPKASTKAMKQVKFMTIEEGQPKLTVS